MNIGIDARYVAKGRGLGEFSRQLLYGLAELGLDHQYYIYTTRSAKERLDALPPNFHKRWVISEYVSAEQLHMPWLMHHDGLDVLHAVNNTAPLLARVPVVLTIHDMMFSAQSRIIPPSASLYQRLGRHYYDIICQSAAPKAAKIATDSEFSKQDICRILQQDEQSVAVIYGGVGPEFRPATKDQQLQVKRQYGLPDRYMFALGAVDPRKQTNFIVEHFLTFAQQHADVDLVISGMEPHQSAQLVQKATEAGLAERLHMVGFVPSHDLVQLIAAAQVFLFPSLYEGFGLPVLQAMACGTPVICSNSSSLPEVGGQAVYYIDPQDGKSFIEALNKLMSDASLGQQLSKHGLLRVTSFTWKETAKQYMKVYQDVAS